MQTNTVTSDKTRTDQKSQRMDNPYIQNLKLYNDIRGLLDTEVLDNKWFSKTSKILNIRKKELTNGKALFENWQDSWGKLHIAKGDNGLIWLRPDGGPDLHDTSGRDLRIVIIRYMLNAKLIEVLPKIDQSSYERVGETRDWRRAKVYLNGSELEKVVFADAISGTCEVLTSEVVAGEIVKRIMKGKVKIELMKDNLSFF